MIIKNIKRHFKKNGLYYWIRDLLFRIEIKREKKIEREYGFSGIKEYVCKWYYKNTKKILDLEHPKTLSEKQQWIKLFDTSDFMSKCADKIAVRSILENKIDGLNFIPLILIDGKSEFNNAEEIDFDKLPNQFVISCNHGSSMTIVVNDKSRLSVRKIKSIKKRLNRWLSMDIAYAGGFDFVYKGIKPRLYISQYLSNNESGLQDYKFLCFNGDVKYVWIDSDRFINHRRTVLNLDFTKADFQIDDYEDVTNIEKPKNYNEMIENKKKLSSDFKFVRVDLYNVEGTIYFGELTFNTNGGIVAARPEEYDFLLGDMLKL